MTEKIFGAGITILLGIIGVAVIAMLVSRSANTTEVISAGAGGFACVLKTALTGTNQCSQLESVTSRITF
jgi:hypothetical protein